MFKSRETSPNKTDVNSTNTGMDEDGEHEETQGEGEVNESDDSPVIHSLAVKPEQVPGMAQMRTTIIATVTTPAIHGDEVEHDAVVGHKEVKDKKTGAVSLVPVTKKAMHRPVIHPGGLQSKRIVITGEVTAQKLATLLQSVATW